MYRQLGCIGVEDCDSQVTVFEQSMMHVLNYIVAFSGTSNNGLTWLYKVHKLSGNDLSHFDIQLCFDDFEDPVDLITHWAIYEYDFENDICLTPPLVSSEDEPITGDTEHFKILLNGDGVSTPCTDQTPLIKFDNLDFIKEVNGEVVDITDFCFEFTLARCYRVECALIGLKAATVDGCRCIQGPSPTCEPCSTPTRGILYCDKK